jgi:drug/metabolite transporter (DMT)-like permease
MFAAFLTTIFFSLSVIFAARTAKVLGGPAANLGRITLATGLLAIWAHGWGAGLGGPALPWYFLSGVIGFGLGDLALFGALTRIGPRLSILLTQCLAAPFAAFAEWLWLGTTLHLAEFACVLVILGGVALALAPDRGSTATPRVFWLGVLFGIGSALGQALGAVVSRKAFSVAEAASFSIDGGSAAYQRIIGGLIVTAFAFLWFHLRGQTAIAGGARAAWGRAWPWVVANACAGPAIGVGCFQWALQTTRAGIVLPIVATSPLVTLLLAWAMEGERPTRRAISGGLIAVAGVIALRIAEGGQ